MMRLFKTLTFLFTLFISLNCLGQDSTIIRIGPTYYPSSEKTKYIYIVDGIPIFKNKQILRLIDTTMIDSIKIHKEKIYNCKNKLLYNAFIEIQTKDSLNLGLKRILHQTDNWIFYHPLSDLYINNKKTNWVKGYRKLIIQPDLIEKIELFDSSKENKYCGHEMIKITVKNE